MKENRKTKKIGQVFTPQYIVDEMLNYVGYVGPSIIGKHIIDNSCGDGAFLKSAVTRYCNESIKLGRGVDNIKLDLEEYIHGIDTDEIAYQQCIVNLNQIAQEFGIEDINWDLYNQSSLSMTRFNGKMDFVVGNPPYVRVHNLDSFYDEVKRYKFANGGMTDLYLAFFELGFRMLNSTGQLCYITPSSWLNSIAALNMRLYILKEQNLVSLVDLGHFQAFENATAYTIISLFAKNRKDKHFDYYTFDGINHCRIFCDRIQLEDCFIDSYFYLSNKESLKTLREVKTKKCPTYVSVKNGFATLADSVFIGDSIPESNITIKTLKASTGKWYKCLFPYDNKGKLLPPEIALSNTDVCEYFNKHKNELLKGRTDYPTFYEFGRTQALADVWKDKIAINTLLRTEKDIKIEIVKAGCGVYSGLYLISELKIPYEDIRSILISKEFAKYVSLLKKYKSGGYYTFNSKDVQQYINYYITYKSEKKYVDQSSIFGENFRLF
ncbi:MAG: N-6 DNA methylase [Coprobacter sp.]|nr:N-6 DNA methylase [Coprobacter sp.]